MKVDFTKIEEVEMKNFKGGEKSVYAKMIVDGNNRIMKARLVPGATIGLHTHDTSSEIIFILEGVATAITNGEEEQLFKGDCHYCEKGSRHTFINNGNEDVVIFAVVPQQ